MSQDWELLPDGAVADTVERLNLAALDRAVEALVVRGGVPGEADLRHLHRVATHLLLRRPGVYRRAYVHLKDDEGYASDDLRPPPPRAVPKLMRGFLRELEKLWRTGDGLDVAAFACWRIASIHPFPNGNGRVAMAFAYACLCIAVGGVLPGRPTMLQQQTADSRPAYKALTVAHRSYARTGRADLRPLRVYLDGLLLRQMKTARRRARRSKPR